VRGVTSSRTHAPLSMATIGVLALAAISCLVLVAFPAFSILSTGYSSPVDSSALMATSRHSRALLSDAAADVSTAERLALAADAEDGLVPYTVLSADGVPEGEYDEWVGVDDEAHHVLLSAAFICNHTTCVAVPKGDGPWTRVVPQVPVEFREEVARARNSLEATVFRALGGSDGVAGQHPPTPFSAGEHLRGDGDTESKCADDHCEESSQSTGEALSMAGLFAPQSCELVLRSRGAARTRSVGTEIAHTFSAPAHVDAVVGARQEESVTGGGVALLKSVHGPSGVQSASQQQQFSISKGLNKSESQHVISVLFPAWKNEVEEEGVLTPMRHMYVLVAEEQDLLTYECSLSRALYI
jgi:hypothetical protein